MADIVIDQGTADPVTGVQRKVRYKDMGDGTYAEVIARPVPTDGTIIPSTAGQVAVFTDTNVVGGDAALMVTNVYGGEFNVNKFSFVGPAADSWVGSFGQLNVKSDVANSSPGILIADNPATATAARTAGLAVSVESAGALMLENTDPNNQADMVASYWKCKDGATNPIGVFEFQATGLGDGSAWFGFNFDPDFGNIDSFLMTSTGHFWPGTSDAQDLGSATGFFSEPRQWRAGYINQIKSTPVALATLGAAATAGAGTRAMISDGLTLGDWGAIAADGGVVVKPVWSNGVAWLNG